MKNFSFQLIKRVLTLSSVATVLLTEAAHALPYVKADNSTALDVDGSYTTPGVPTSSDTIVVDNTLTAARTVTVGSGISVLGLDLQASLTQNFSINPGSGTLTLGSEGITKDTANLFSLAATVNLATAQTWSINSGDLRLSSAITTNGNLLSLSGEGTLEVRGTNTYGSEITISTATVVSNQATTITTLGGANTFTTLNFSRGRVIGSTLGNFGEASSFGSGGTNSAIILGAGSGGPGILEYAGLTATSNRTFSRSGSNATASNAVIEVSSAGETLTLLGDLTSTSTATNGSWQFGGAGNLRVQGIISDQANTGVTSIVKADTGTLILEAANTYEGTTTVNSGTLLVNNAAGSGLGGGNAIVNDSAVLGGNGSFSGSVTVNSGGILSPGSSVETLESGTVTFNTGATFAYEVDSGVSTAIGADLQKVNGDLSLNGVVALTLNDLNTAPAPFQIGATFTLVNYAGTWNGGLFSYGANVIANGGSFSAGLNSWQIIYNATSGGENFAGEYFGGNFVNITAVPEPSSAMTVAIGALALLATGLLRRRRSCR